MNRCSACKHWGKPGDAHLVLAYRECGKVEGVGLHNAGAPAVIARAASDAPTLSTTAAFGCILFEPRGPR